MQGVQRIRGGVKLIGPIGPMRSAASFACCLTSALLAGGSLLAAFAQPPSLPKGEGTLRGAQVPFSEVVAHFFLSAQAYGDHDGWAEEDRNAFGRRYGIAPGSVALEGIAGIFRSVERSMPPEDPVEVAARANANRSPKDLAVAKDLAKERSYLLLRRLGRAYGELLLDLEQEGSVDSYASVERRILERQSITLTWVDEENPAAAIAAREAAFASGVQSIIPTWESPR